MARQDRVGRYVVNAVLTHGPSATTATVTTPILNGILYAIQGVPPAAVDGGATVDLTVTDQDGIVVWNSSLTPGQPTYGQNLFTAGNACAVNGVLTIAVTYSVAQTATNSTTKVVLLVDRG